LLASIENRIRFLTLRLQHASPAEWKYRLRQAIQGLRIRIFPLKHAKNRVKDFDFSRLRDLELPALESTVAEEDIEAIFHGKKFTLGDGDLEREDIRAKWEPARLQHVAVLTSAFVEQKGSRRLADFARESVLAWIQANPFPKGVHYLSAMECGLRIPVFFACIKVLPLTECELQRILTAVYQHAWLISHRLSLYSSLGNHTIAESVGLVFAGAALRNLAQGSGWLNKGYQLLEQEVTHQILEDGGPVEQSLSYHRFVLDLFWLAVNFLEENRIRDCSLIKQRLLKGEEFLAAFRYSTERLPAIGDSDDGYAVGPSVSPKRPVVQNETRRLSVFRESGYSVIRTVNGAIVTFDHGPLGMAPFYNHGHADALSITLSKNGKEILVDPGTYRYNGAPEFRKYFKGTRAQNTVTIDGMDQATQETSFIWSRPYKCTLEKAEQRDGDVFVQASHNGYSRLSDPVNHRRAILYSDQDAILIKDSFSGRGVHLFELNFHLHPEARWHEKDGWVVLDREGEKVFLMLLGKHGFSFHSGEKNPPFGWYSPAYGIKMETTVLSCQMEGPPSEVSFLTVIGTEAHIEMDIINQKAELI
jgi:hypothetical protein